MKLKLFIWRTEYDVIMSIAETVEEARKIIKKKHKTRKQYFKKFAEEVQKSGFKEKIYNQYCKEKETDSYIENEEELKVLKQEPSMVIPVDQKMGRIYQHGNEWWSWLLPFDT